MTTAQDILRSVLSKAGLDYLNSALSSDEQQVIEVVDLMNETGQDLALRGEWQALLRSAPVGDLPDDFSKISFVSTDVGPARRITDPGQWGFLADHPTAQPYYRIARGKVSVLPDTTATVSYWSAYWSDAGARVSADGDEVFLPMGIMVSGTLYRWLRKKGMPFDDQMAQHEADVAAAQKADRGL